LNARFRQSNFGKSTGEAKASTGHIRGDILAAMARPSATRETVPKLFYV
jgi:hypothetical protein